MGCGQFHGMGWVVFQIDLSVSVPLVVNIIMYIAYSQLALYPFFIKKNMDELLAGFVE